MIDKNLKNFFAKKETEDIRTTDSDDYTVVKNRRVDMVLRILSLLCAIVIWVSIVIGDSATKEFQNFSVTVKGGSVLSRTHTFSYDFTQVNFEIQGQGTQISQLQEQDLQVYVDLSSISSNPNFSTTAETQVFDLPLIYEPKRDKGNTNIIFIQKSRESIKVTVTKKTS